MGSGFNIGMQRLKLHWLLILACMFITQINFNYSICLLFHPGWSWLLKCIGRLPFFLSFTEFDYYVFAGFEINARPEDRVLI